MSNRHIIDKMQRKKDLEAIMPLVMAGTVIAVIVAIALIQPYFEAKAYNKFTQGQKATYWDAMWATLRVNSQ